MKSGRLPPLNALRAFEAVSRHSQVTRAAHELSVTPSAVSHLIRRLEEDLKVQLIKRSGRNIELTESGAKLAPELQDIFRSLSRIVGETRSSARHNLLTVSLRPYFAVKWLAPRLDRFWVLHPEIELRLHHTNSPVDFIAEPVDLSIEWLQGNRFNTTQTEIIPGELTPVCHPELFSKKINPSLDELCNHTLLRETDHDSWTDWFSLFNRTVPEEITSLYIDDSNVRNQAAIDGQGIELSCRTLISDDVSAGRLCAPFAESLDLFSYYLVEPAHISAPNAARCFKDWIMAEIKRDNALKSQTHPSQQPHT